MDILTRAAPRLLIVILAIGLVGCQGSEQESGEPSGTSTPTSGGGWTHLFPGENFEGWSKHGGAATYELQDSTIIGTSVRNSENTFLCTNETYGDFELRFETRVHDSLNSGVQIRSRVRADDDRVYGPQVEIEASLEEGAEAGYIYGEGMGIGWITPDDSLEPTMVFQDGLWNQYRILADGSRIQTWVNGRQISDLTAEEIYQDHREGRICLQVHGVGDEGPYDVAWRNIQTREL